MEVDPVYFQNLLNAFQSGRLQPLGGILPLRDRLDFPTSEAGGRARWSLLPIARVSEVAAGTTRRPDHPIAGGGRRQVGRRAWQSR